jgi:glycogen debranching enzyme
VIGKLGQFLTRALWSGDLPKFYLIDVDKSVQDLVEFDHPLPKAFAMLRMRALTYAHPQRVNILRARGVKGTKIDINYAAALYKPAGVVDPLELELYRTALQSINAPSIQHLGSVIQDIVKNVIKSVRYRFIDPDGLRLPSVSASNPLVDPYFATIPTPNGVLRLISNGYILDANPTTDFVAPESEAYLRRQIVAWTDNVKLRYGSSPDSSPFLWQYMSKYVESVAEVCAAIRVDQAHTTPLHVGEYFIRLARSVNPNLCVMAELFTGGEAEDILYMQRLGITSIMREGCYRQSPKEITALLWASGGRSVAAIDHLDRRSVLRPSAHCNAVVFDLTHDNTFLDFDRVVSTAAVSMAASAIGSTR